MTFEQRNLKEWENTIKDIFDGKPPHSMEWYGNATIIDILNKLGSVKHLCHMFYPSGGGMLIKGAKESVEPGCIELITDGGEDIVRPQKLRFHFFGEQNYEWAYFRLETGVLAPSGVYENYDDIFTNDIQYEEVTELRPGKYVERYHWDAGYYGYDENGEKPLPKEARAVSRIFKGAFVFFATTSIYNRTSSTYDARHNKMTSQEFEEHIKGAIDYITQKDKEKR